MKEDGITNPPLRNDQQPRFATTDPTHSSSPSLVRITLIGADSAPLIFTQANDDLKRKEKKKKRKIIFKHKVFDIRMKLLLDNKMYMSMPKLAFNTLTLSKLY